jgi:hypothetical protein
MLKSRAVNSAVVESSTATATSPVSGLSLAHYDRHVHGSRISPLVAQQRGYRTLVSPEEAKALGFSEKQAYRVPALLVPLWGIDGRAAGHLLRPDFAGVDDKGRTPKYFAVPEATNVLDVAPGSRLGLRDPATPVIIVEGSKKVDSIASALARKPDVGRLLVGLSLSGVANWRGRNSHGGRGVALPEWREIPWQDKDEKARDVFLGFDSDAFTKKGVHRELSGLYDHLTGLGANVQVIRLPDGKDGAKMGVDDALVAGYTIADLLNLAEHDIPALHGDHRRFFSAAELGTRPDVQWLVGPSDPAAGDGLLPEVGVGGIYGEPGTGKSLVALDLSAHIVLGRPWCGRPVRRGPVVFLAGEGVAGLPQRIRAWTAHHGVPDAALADLHFWPVAEDLAHPKVAAELVEAIRARCGSPALVIVDTVARFMAGRDENLQVEFGAFIKSCDRIRSAFDCCVLTIHHPNKKGEARGSTTYLGALETLLELELGKSTDDLTLRVEKQKDALDEDVYVQLKRVRSGKSVVITPGRPVARQTIISPRALKLLGGLKEDVPTTTKVWYAGLPAEKRKTLDRAREELIRSGFAVGTEKRRGYSLTPSGARFLVEHQGVNHVADDNPTF